VSVRRASHSLNDEDRPPRRRREHAADAEEGMETYRIEVGREHGVQPKHIVGAIANEAGLESRHIGRINLEDEYSTVDLPEGMPKDVYKHLRKVWVCGRQLNISRFGDDAGDTSAPPKRQAPTRDKPQGKKKPRATPKR
jgi:ATP-dependent RNA helicase DeaD